MTNAMPQFKQLVAGFSPRRPGFDPRIFCIGFLVDKVALSIFICHFRLLHHQCSMIMIDQPQKLEDLLIS